jgi:phage FluMu gp28-like protein
MPASAKKIDLNYKQPFLYPKQKAAIFDPARISVIEASTKSGKTSGCIVWLIEQALAGKEGWNYWWVAPISRVARIAFTRAMRALPKHLYVSNLGDHTLTLVNGAVIWFLGADNPDSLYGEDVHAAVIDEGSRFKEQAFHAVYTTLTATGGKLRIIGNVKGRRNWFYQLARVAARGDDPEYGYHKLVSDDAVAAGIFPTERVEAAKRALPAAVFRELYMAEPSDDQGNPFGFDAIRKCIKPLSTGKPQAWGWDLAKSHDWSVGVGLDNAGTTCRFERFQTNWEATKLRIIGLTRTDRALVDSTGVGDPVLEGLQKAPGSKFEGYIFSSRSKQQLMEGLAVAIQTGEIGYPEGVITQELEVFEYEYTQHGVKYAAPEGYFDDCVMALGLANNHRSHAAPKMVITPEILRKAKTRVRPEAFISRMGSR